MSNRLTQPPAKILLNNTTNISLHDRFSKIAKVRREPPVAITKTINKDTQKTSGSAKNRRLAEQMANRPAVQAALKLKKKSVGLSIKQRIGAKVGTPTPGRSSSRPPAQRHSLPVRKRIGGAPARTNLYRANNRGNSTTMGNGVRRRLNAARPQTTSAVNQANGSGSGAVVKTAIFRRGGGNRGIARGFNNRRTGFNQQRPRGGLNRTGNTPVKRLSGGGPIGITNNNNRGNRRGGRRGGSNNRGRFQQRRGNNNNNSRNNGRGGKPQVPANKDALDKDIDSYMKQSKNHLDADLDTYMSQAH